MVQEQQFEKFMKMLQKLHVDIPFIDVLTQMPTYAKFLKEILFKKRKIEDYEMVALTMDQIDKMPRKLKDPGEFFILAGFGSLTYDCLCDLGSSVNIMLLSSYSIKDASHHG